MPWGLTPSCVPAERLQEVARGERAWATAAAPAVAGARCQVAPPRHARRAGSRCGRDEEGGRASVLMAERIWGDVDTLRDFRVM